MFKNRSTIPEGKMRRFVHNPWNLEDERNKVKISGDRDGRVTLKKEIEVEGEIEEHEITVSANTIYQIASMLNTTRKTHLVDKK